MTPEKPKRAYFAMALLLTQAMLACSAHAQHAAQSDPPGRSPVGVSNVRSLVDVAPGADTSRGSPEHQASRPSSFVITLPPTLRKRFQLDLGIADALSATAQSATAQRSASPSTPDLKRPARISGSNSAARRRDRAVGTRRYFVTDLGTLGGSQSFAYGLNDSGQIVGLSRTAGDDATHGFLYSDGRMISLFPLNSGELQTVGPTGINNAGQIASGLVVDGVYFPAILDSRSAEITLLGSLGSPTSFGFSGVATAVSNLGDAVGYSHVDETKRHAFVYFNGRMSDIDAFGENSAALDVNDEGVAVGFASTPSSDGRSHAFVYENGAMTDIDPLGGTSESTARGINSKGEVVGEFLTEDGTAHHAFLYSEGAFHDLGATESPETVAFAINDQSQIVGVTLVPKPDLCLDPESGEYVFCITHTPHAFLHEAGNMVDLNTLIPRNTGWELQWAFDVNLHGQIVGYGLVEDRFRAFLLTPARAPQQCRGGAWRTFGFANQGKCHQFVTGRR